MEFKKDLPIWKQIADGLGDEVLEVLWTEGERVPSVRERAAGLGVNPHTVVRAYGILEEAGVLSNQRGMGYFVAPGAKERLIESRRKEFLDFEVPELKLRIKQLGLTRGDLEGLWS